MDLGIVHTYTSYIHALGQPSGGGQTSRGRPSDENPLSPSWDSRRRLTSLHHREAAAPRRPRGPWNLPSRDGVRRQFARKHFRPRQERPVVALVALVANRLARTSQETNRKQKVLATAGYLAGVKGQSFASEDKPAYLQPAKTKSITNATAGLGLGARRQPIGYWAQLSSNAQVQRTPSHLELMTALNYHAIINYYAMIYPCYKKVPLRVLGAGTISTLSLPCEYSLHCPHHFISLPFFFFFLFPPPFPFRYSWYQSSLLVIHPCERARSSPVVLNVGRGTRLSALLAISCLSLT